MSGAEWRQLQEQEEHQQFLEREQMSDTAKKTGLELLRVPFAAHQISKLPKPYKKDSQKGNCTVCGGYHGLPAMHLDYVGHAALTDRLLDVDPAWSWEPVAFDDRGLPALDKDGGLWIRLTVCGVTRLGYGDAQDKTGGDAMKERIGDALRNAAMRFGAALELWHKGQLHADDDGDDPGAGSTQTSPKRQTLSEKQVAEIEAVITEIGRDISRVSAYLAKHYEVKSMSEIPAVYYDEIVSGLRE